jgi:hypothetical protein
MKNDKKEKTMPKEKNGVCASGVSIVIKSLPSSPLRRSPCVVNAEALCLFLSPYPPLVVWEGRSAGLRIVRPSPGLVDVPH